MLSRKLKINLSNPCLGLLPTLILMLTDTVLGKFEAYLAGIITSCCINFYLYFFIINLIYRFKNFFKKLLMKKYLR